MHGSNNLVWADVDLNDLRRDWTGAAFKDVCWYQRREETYKMLAGAKLPKLGTE